ncbi:MAG: hypothetical protein ACYS32_04205 [Planctomycetota bacterium]|jgi:hypothetical protein
MRLNRRYFLKQAMAGGAGLFAFNSKNAFAKTSDRVAKCKIRTLTSGTRHHFFGYYGICPWNKSGKYVLSLESGFVNHFPGPDEPAAIGVVDSESGKFEKVTETGEWNLQQGAMLHWNPLDDHVLFSWPFPFLCVIFCAYKCDAHMRIYLKNTGSAGLNRRLNVKYEI